ncbi:KHG/KDPG aldolase-like isoform X2 [Salvia hispanica]|uniref:KHG/KDPG aldolase-like isoform X2 n=1 Tax=Salvia hispanica TaxID=49212 RepID=UPI002009452E|nr:KHG/KDPG aldolase-like isoform X2 [Salvia hispanica]
MIVPIANKVGIVSTRIDTCRSSLFCSKNSSVSLHPTNVADRVLMDIQNSGIIACLRAKSAELAVEAARAALRGGISVLEITMSTPGVFEALQCLVQEYPSASIGVGTVLDRRVAKEAVHIGAKFLMSPAMVKGILSDVAEGQALYIPGAATPTEVLSASTDGAKLIKLTDTDSVGAYICEGASAVVLSDAIFDKKAMAERNFLRIHHLACSAATKGNQAVRKIKCMDE